MKKLENKVAVITGGNSGIGLAAARLFIKEGARLTITGRNKNTIDATIAELGHPTFGLVNDVSQISNIDETYKEISSKFGKIDVLVVNAGLFVSTPLVDYTEEIFDQIVNTNFKGAFFSVQKALPYLHDGASVILVASSAQEKAMPNGSAYAASKAAVRSLSRSFSAELLERNIRVNTFSPGPTDTPIFGRNGASQEQLAAIKTQYEKAVPAGRMGTPEEMAEAILYLASDDSRYMIGAEIILDGGKKAL